MEQSQNIFLNIFRRIVVFFCPKMTPNGKLSDVADFVKRNYKIISGKNQIKNKFIPL